MSTSTPSYKRDRIPIGRCHLYGIRSTHALAIRLGWELKKLEALAMDGGYSVYPHRKTGRIIQEPGKSLQELHKQLHKYLSRVEVPDYLHSAVKGRSYLSNAEAHVGGGSLIKVEIAKFYRSIPQYKVMHFFRDAMNCASDVAGLLANLICYNSHLATGSSISPLISYFAFKNMFDKLLDLADRNGLRMTCYIDDVAMSGERASIAVLREARSIIFQEGLSAHKDRHFQAENAKLLTGVIVGQTGISLPKSRWKKIRKAISSIKAATSDAQKLKQYPPLVSRLYEATQIEPRCRKLAEHHHQAWRLLKRDQAVKVAVEPQTKDGVISRRLRSITPRSIAPTGASIPQPEPVC